MLIPRPLFDDAAHRIAEDESSVERARKKISDSRLHIQASRSAEEAVMREASFNLEEVDGVETTAQARLAQRCLRHVHYQDLR